MTTNTKSAQERTASIDLAQLDKLRAEFESLAQGDNNLARNEHDQYLNAGTSFKFQGFVLARRSLTSGSPAKPVARLMHWIGPKSQTPHDGICARTYSEFSEESAKDSKYWREGEKLFSAGVHDTAALSNEKMREVVRDAVANSLTGLYYCGRVWSAWGYGTMNESDFTPAAEDDDIIENIASAAIDAMSAGAAAKTEQAMRECTFCTWVGTPDSCGPDLTCRYCRSRTAAAPSATAAGAGSPEVDPGQVQSIADRIRGHAWETGRAAGAGSAQPRAEGGERALSKADIDEIVYKCRQSGKDTTYDIVNAAIRAALDQGTQAATTASASRIKTWQERVLEIKPIPSNKEMHIATVRARDAEIADLRAALASAPLPAQGGAQPVDDARDAARYRAWRDAVCSESEDFHIAIMSHLPASEVPTAEKVDEAIDAAMRANDSAAEGDAK